MPYLTIIFWFAVMACSLFILLKSAYYFTGIAEIFGKVLKIPAFIIGATVVAFGTSLPELAVSVAAIFNTGGDIVAGTVVGSNISNIFLIGGIAIFMAGFVVEFKKHYVEFILLIISTFAIASILWDKKVSLYEGAFLVILLIVYLVYIIYSPKKEDDSEHTKPKWTTYVLFVLSIGGIWIGAKYTTQAIEEISSILGIGNNLIAQTVLALGTSLPELAVTIASAKKKQYEIILGNIIGSNIFNALSVIGIPAVLASYSNLSFELSSDVFNQFAIPMMILATLLLLLLSFLKSTPKYFGFLFLALYALFIVGSFLELNLFKFWPF